MCSAIGSRREEAPGRRSSPSPCGRRPGSGRTCARPRRRRAPRRKCAGRAGRGRPCPPPGPAGRPRSRSGGRASRWASALPSRQIVDRLVHQARVGALVDAAGGLRAGLQQRLLDELDRAAGRARPCRARSSSPSALRTMRSPSALASASELRRARASTTTSDPGADLGRVGSAVSTSAARAAASARTRSRRASASAISALRAARCASTAGIRYLRKAGSARSGTTTAPSTCDHSATASKKLLVRSIRRRPRADRALEHRSARAPSTICASFARAASISPPTSRCASATIASPGCW